MNRSSQAIYLPGLNGIRAMAALSVVLSHVGLRLGFFNGHEQGFTTILATESVHVFFALSGFLITYLLLVEEDERGTIGLKAFYVRRMLRIWPLYFGYILFSVCHNYFLHHDDTGLDQLWLMFFFLPNIADFVGHMPQDTTPLWSIGSEEQFYILWPILFRYRGKRIVSALLIFILAWNILRVASDAYGWPRNDKFSLLHYLSYDCMAIGALFAFLFHRKSSWLLGLAHSIWVLVLFGGLVVMLFFNGPYFFFTPEIVCVAACLFIVFQVQRSDHMFSLENKWFRFLGSISYGVYVLNFLTIRVLADLTNHFLPNTVLPTPVIYVLVFAANILIAWLSYSYYERPFLQLKSRFALIASTSTGLPKVGPSEGGGPGVTRGPEVPR